MLYVIVEFTHEIDCGLLRDNYSKAEENLLIMNVVQIESICLLFTKNKGKFEKLLKKLFNIDYLKSIYYNINEILFELDIDFNNFYYEKGKNYIIDLVEELRNPKEKNMI